MPSELREQGDNTILRAAQWLHQHTSDPEYIKGVEGTPVECAVVHFNRIMAEFEKHGD